MPGDTSFMLPAGKGSPAAYFRFTAQPSAAPALSSLYQQVLAVLVAALFLSGLAGWLLSRWLSRPVLRLVTATEAVAGGNFLHTVDRTGIAELDQLADQFNAMVLQLRESFRALATDRDTAQRFAADAAHELKTPVTTLRAYYEVLAEHPERLHRVSTAIARQIGRMERIISGLLEMANLSEGGGIILESGDLHALLQRMAPAYRAQADASGHRLTTAWPDGAVPVVLDHRLLELGVNNLIENACKYTAPGGQLALMLECDGSDAVITVVDSGKGIPPKELAHSFDRFHRGVDSQSIPGSGLGLRPGSRAADGGHAHRRERAGCGQPFLHSTTALAAH